MEKGGGDQQGAEGLVEVLLAPTIKERMALRVKYSRRPDPISYLAALRALPPIPFEMVPVLCLSVQSSPRGELESEEDEEGADGSSMVSFPFPPLREMRVQNAADLCHKEAVYVAKRRQALFLLRDYMWAIGVLSLRRVAAERHWGTVPDEVAKLVQDARRNKKDTRVTLKELWGRWPTPFEQMLDEWDEVYLAEFPEVVDRPERPGSTRWRSFYSKFTRDFLGSPSDLVASLMSWRPQNTHTLHFVRSGDEVEYLDRVLSELDKRVGRDPSQMRPIHWEVRTKKEVLSPEKGLPEIEPEQSEESVECWEARDRGRPRKLRKGESSKAVLRRGVSALKSPVQRQGGMQCGPAVRRVGRPPLSQKRKVDMFKNEEMKGDIFKDKGMTVKEALRLWRSQAVCHVNAMMNLLAFTQSAATSTPGLGSDRELMASTCEEWDVKAHSTLLYGSKPVGGTDVEHPPMRARLVSDSVLGEVAGPSSVEPGVSVGKIVLPVHQLTEEEVDARYRETAVKVATAYVMALKASPGMIAALKGQVDAILQQPVPDLVEAATALASEAASLQAAELELQASAPGVASTPVEGVLPEVARQVEGGDEAGALLGLTTVAGTAEEQTEKGGVSRATPCTPLSSGVQGSREPSERGARGSVQDSTVGVQMVQSKEVEGESKGSAEPSAVGQVGQSSHQGTGLQAPTEVVQGNTDTATSESPGRKTGRPKPRMARTRGSRIREGTDVATGPGEITRSQGKK